MKSEVNIHSLTKYYFRKNVLTLIFSSRFEIVCWRFVIVTKHKYNQTLVLVNNWMIIGIQGHNTVDTLVTQHIHTIMFLFMHYKVRYEGRALFPPWALLDIVTLYVFFSSNGVKMVVVCGEDKLYH